MKNHSFKNQEGIVLVLSLILMSILLSVAIGFGVIIISDIRQARSVDNSIVAYFAADAGIERNLFLLRKQEDVEGVGDILFETKILSGNGSSWDISSSVDFETSFFRQRISNGQSWKLFFLDRGDVNQVKSINIFWNKSEISPTKMQVSFTRLTLEDIDGGSIFVTDKNEVLISTSSNSCFPFESANSDYAVEIKALGPVDGYIDSLTVKGYGTDDCSGEVASSSISNITLISEGIYNNSRQRIIAHIPPRTPVSGIFSFVLFSEEDITKR